jgi:hypothetical protein
LSQSSLLEIVSSNFMLQFFASRSM